MSTGAENARLRATADQRGRWLAATAEITNVLLGHVNPTGALKLVARRVREAAGAQLVLVLLADEYSGQLTVEVCDADDVPPALAGTVLAVGETAFAAALSETGEVVLDDLGKAAAWPVPVTTGPALVTALAADDVPHGLLVVAQPPGGASQPDDLPMLRTFAGQAALALERARAQEERDHLVVVEDRERIARDLHDVVIQRLFATGLHLQTAAQFAAEPETAQRIATAVDDLDTTIRDIRTAIFELRTPMSAALRSEIRDLVAEAAGPLGFRPELRLVGPLDSAVPDGLRPDLLAVIRESLSNAARHARATTVRVTVEAGDGRLAVHVADNGVGTDGARARGGLVNLRERAEGYGGRFAVSQASQGGTDIVWSIPL